MRFRNSAPKRRIYSIIHPRRRHGRQSKKRMEKRWKKGVANLWSRKKITKKARAARGPESKWEIQLTGSGFDAGRRA
jgi:hypothetical protein